MCRYTLYMCSSNVENMVVFRNTNVCVYRLETEKSSVLSLVHTTQRLSRGGELGDSLGTLGDGMLGKFSRKEKSDSGLDLTGGKGGLLVVSGKLGGFKGDSVEDIVDEGVQDGDTLLGDTSLRVNLFQHLVDVGRVGFNSLLGLGTSLLGGLCSFLSWCLGHCVTFLNHV